MAGFLTTNTDHIIRSNLWSSNLKEVFEAETYATQWIDWIN